VLGVPGETIEFRENAVQIDGRPLPVHPAATDFGPPTPRARANIATCRHAGSVRTSTSSWAITAITASIRERRVG
jgi:hypothetical protein